jgi:uncharacterized membrane protein YphA (DoxX/SURF4 family)
MFPQGGPGFALLLLRFSVAGVFVVGVWTMFGTAVQHWTFFAALLLGILLCLGFQTPITATLVCLAAIIMVVLKGGVDSALNFSTILNGLALALLGPGAYSLDAQLFGRRVMVVTSSKHTQDRQE